MLRRRFGELSPSVVERISVLSLDQVGALGEALLDFGAIADLETWLANVEPSA
jgi:Domain of unknown function (DUF4351)